MSRSTNYIPLKDVLHKLEIIGKKVWDSDTPQKNNSSVIVDGDSYFDGKVCISGHTVLNTIEADEFTLPGGNEAWVMRSDINSEGNWSVPYWKTNDNPLNINGPSDDFVYTGYKIGIDITNPSEQLEVNGNTIISDQFIGDYVGAPTTHTAIAHKDYKSDATGYAMKIKDDSELDLNSQVKINLNISDTLAMSVNSLGNVGIGTNNPNENLHVAGNVQVDGNLNIDGDLTYINSTTVEVEDPNLFLARNNPADSMDIGIFGQYVDSAVTKYTGIFRDANDEPGYYKFFHNLEEKPTTTVNTSGTGYQNGNLHLGGLKIDYGITFSTNDAFIYEDNLILDSRSGDGNGFVGIGLTAAPEDSMDINHGIIVRNGNLKVGLTDSNASVHIDRDDVIVIPVGNTEKRLDITGGIRYNNEIETFEGYKGDTWCSLGGVIDVDQDTYISAETSPGADNDELKFLTGGSEKMIINSSGNVGINKTNPTTKFHVDGTSTFEDTVNINANIIIAGHIIPTSNETYDIGATNSKFKDLYLSGDTIHLGETTISASQEALTLNKLNVSTKINSMTELVSNYIYTTGNIDIQESLNITGNLICQSTSTINNLNVTDNLETNSLNVIANTDLEGNLDIVGNLICQSTSTINNLNVTNSLETSSLQTGSLNVIGDTDLQGNLTVHGTTTTVNTEVVTIEDPIIKLSSNNTNNLVDMGFYGKYVENDVTKYAGLVKDASENEFKLFSSEEEPTTTVNIGATSYLDAKLKLGDLDASGTVDIDSNLIIPIGNTSQRVNVTGSIRYNSEIETFEGFKGTWGSLGGVIDVDQDTYILAETSAGTDNDELKFVTSGNERMIIDSNGNVGIGDTPSYPVHINKINLNNWSTKISNSDTEILFAHSDGSAMNINSGVSSNINSYIMNVKNNTNSSIFNIHNNENIGINNSNPTEKLDIVTTTSSEGANIGYAFIGNSSNESNTTVFSHKDLKSNNNEFAIKQNNNGETTINSKTNNNLKLGINNSTKMIIKSDGKIGIHTENPNQNVEIQDNTLINSNSNVSLTVTNTDSNIFIANSNGNGIIVNSGTTENYALQLTEDSNDLFRVYNSGNVVIGITNTDSKMSIEDNLKINHKDSYIKLNTTDNLNTINSNVPISLGVSDNNILYVNDSKVSIDSNDINYKKFNVNGSQYISDALLINTTSSTYQLDVSGDTKLGGDVVISGLLTFEGVSADGLEFQDSLIKIGNNNTDNSEDIGIYGKYVDDNTTKYCGIIKDATDDKFKIFKDLEVEPTTTVNIGATGYTLADLVVNNLEINTIIPIGSQIDIDGNIGITGSILPAVDGVFNLGSASNRFGDLYFGGETIHLGDSILKDYDGVFTVTGPAQINELNITHNLDIDGDIDVSGSATISSISVTGAISAGSISLSGNSNMDGNMNFSGDVEITGDLVVTDGNLYIPVGNTAQRVDITGAIRYNTQISTFEGYSGTWGSLGGVIDVDQDTYISAETSAGADNDQLKFFTANSEKMRVDSNGNVGIGITNPVYSLDVDGIIQSNDEVLAPEFTTTCDIRVKENIKRMDVKNILDKVNKLNLYEYNYTNEYNKSNEKIYGLIAQNVKKVLPEAIKYKKMKIGNEYINDFQTISQNTLISSLIGCIHELTDNQRRLGNELINLKKDYYELKDSFILQKELEDLKK